MKYLVYHMDRTRDEFCVTEQYLVFSLIIMIEFRSYLFLLIYKSPAPMVALAALELIIKQKICTSKN